MIKVDIMGMSQSTVSDENTNICFRLFIPFRTAPHNLHGGSLLCLVQCWRNVTELHPYLIRNIDCGAAAGPVSSSPAMETSGTQDTAEHCQIVDVKRLIQLSSAKVIRC